MLNLEPQHLNFITTYPSKNWKYGNNITTRIRILENSFRYPKYSNEPNILRYRNKDFSDFLAFLWSRWEVKSEQITGISSRVLISS